MTEDRARELCKRLNQLAGQIDPCLVGGRDAVLLRDAAHFIETALSTPHRVEGEDVEAVRMAYKTGYQEGVEDGDGIFCRQACEEGWQQYAEKLQVTEPGTEVLCTCISDAGECSDGTCAACGGNWAKRDVIVYAISDIAAALKRSTTP